MKQFISLILVAMVLLACDFGFNLGQAATTPTTIAKPPAPATTQSQPPLATTQPQPPASTQAPPPAATTQPQPRAATQIPQPAATTQPQPLGATQAPLPGATKPLASDLPLFDGFDNPAFENALNPGLWTTSSQVGSCQGISATAVEARQKSGALQFDIYCPYPEYVIEAKPAKRPLVQVFEMRIKVDSKSAGASGKVWMQLNGDAGGSNWKTQCTVEAALSSSPKIGCGTDGEYGIPNSEALYLVRDQWYTIKIEFNPNTYEIGFYLDGKQLGKHTSVSGRLLRSFTPGIGAMNLGGATFGPIYVDDVRITP
ncbi:hypothetical protein ANRL1_02142 [Anaerolineae bacterium]|nr:hypothetical protein ANRL1_02142 [Anaerolineae bacterium]